MVTKLLKQPAATTYSMTAPSSKKNERAAVTPHLDEASSKLFVISEGVTRRNNPKTNANPVATLLSSTDPIPMDRYLPLNGPPFVYD